jgi:hypothetical protein
MNTVNDDNRHFSRIHFDASAVISDGEHEWTTELLDISLKGALVKKPADWQATTGQAFNLQIKLSEDSIILMEASVAHVENNHIGFCCHHIDLDGITHLRRLVELNTGNEDLLQRELSALKDA